MTAVPFRIIEAAALYLSAGYTATSRERLSAIMSTGYEAELHSPARRARRRRGIPERRAAPQLPPRGRRSRRDAIGDEPGGARARGARRRGAVHPHDAQRRPHRGGRTLPDARKTRLRGVGCG